MAPRVAETVAFGPMQQIIDAIIQGAPGEELAAIPLPESYKATVVLASEQTMFDGMDSGDKDPRQALHLQEIAMPELAPDEAVIAVNATRGLMQGGPGADTAHWVVLTLIWSAIFLVVFVPLAVWRYRRVG